MRRNLVGAFVVVVALWAGGCGGDKDDSDDDAGSGDSAETTEAAGVGDGDAEDGDENGATTTAAGGGDEQPDVVEPCDLVSVDEVSSILGTTVTAEEQPAVSGGVVCHWLAPGGAFYTVRLTVGRPDLYELLRSNQFTDLEGLGEEAWSNAYVSAGSPALDIGVRTAEHHVLLFFGETDDLAVGTALATAVVDALAG